MQFCSAVAWLGVVMFCYFSNGAVGYCFVSFAIVRE